MLVLHSVRVLSYGISLKLDPVLFKSEFMILLIFSPVGVWLAQPIGQKLIDRQVDLLIKVLLTAIGIRSLINGLLNYLSF